MSQLPHRVYSKYVHGDKISDAELTEAVPFFKDLSDMLFKCGPVFNLAAVEANRIYHGLLSFQDARAKQ